MGKWSCTFNHSKYNKHQIAVRKIQFMGPEMIPRHRCTHLLPNDFTLNPNLLMYHHPSPERYYFSKSTSLSREVSLRESNGRLVFPSLSNRKCKLCQSALKNSRPIMPYFCSRMFIGKYDIPTLIALNL